MVLDGGEFAFGRGAEAVADKAEYLLDAVVDVVAVQGVWGGDSHELEVAEVFEAVALAVCLGLQGGVAEFRTGLDVEQEQQAIHVAEALEAEVLGKPVVQLEDALLAHFAAIPDGLVADEFDAFAQGVLEVTGDGEGVLVAVVV